VREKPQAQPEPHEAKQCHLQYRRLWTFALVLELPHEVPYLHDLQEHLLASLGLGEHHLHHVQQLPLVQ